ncbi:MAG TPA: hypothetical protein VFM48_00640, partial [Aquabacterium sp.]|nr:hypothetical protein [Aquabacterium sp.]
ASLEQVPWESLQAGDTVRVFYRSSAYLGKFMVSGQGTASQPIRICGVPGPHGERPIIDGAGAVTRPQLQYSNDMSPSGGLLHQTRSVIVIKPSATDDWRYFPAYIQIDGLHIRGATPANQFTDTTGTVRNYVTFGACIWLERGHHITIANNEIENCTNGVFSKSTDDAYAESNATEFSVTKDIRLAGNDVHGNGVVGDDHEHNTYLQSVNVVYEFNHYGPLRSGALGSALKDRSVGSVVRYNRIEEGARSLDLVEAEDFPLTAVANPAYRQTFVYGNQIVKDGTTGVAIHYGGDHGGAPPGANWGESIFRKGTLFFYNNTVVLTGNASSMYLFQLATTEEAAEIWNNVFLFRDSVTEPSLRTGQDVASNYVTGGVLNLGVNWINNGWKNNDQYHPLSSPVYGAAHMLSSNALPIDINSLLPVPSGLAVDTGQVPPAQALAYGVTAEMDANFLPRTRSVSGAAIDLGALEL